MSVMLGINEISFTYNNDDSINAMTRNDHKKLATRMCNVHTVVKLRECCYTMHAQLCERSIRVFLFLGSYDYIPF